MMQMQGFTLLLDQTAMIRGNAAQQRAGKALSLNKAGAVAEVDQLARALFPGGRDRPLHIGVKIGRGFETRSHRRYAVIVNAFPFLPKIEAWNRQVWIQGVTAVAKPMRSLVDHGFEFLGQSSIFGEFYMLPETEDHTCRF